MFGGRSPMFERPSQLLEGWASRMIRRRSSATLKTRGGLAARPYDSRYPVWINLEQGNFNPKALPTAQLASALFIESGSVSLRPGTNLTFTPS